MDNDRLEEIIAQNAELIKQNQRILSLLEAYFGRNTPQVVSGLDSVPQTSRTYYWNDSPCETCPNNGGPKDPFGNPVAGDSMCEYCKFYKWRVVGEMK